MGRPPGDRPVPVRVVTTRAKATDLESHWLTLRTVARRLDLVDNSLNGWPTRDGARLAGAYAARGHLWAGLVGAGVPKVDIAHRYQVIPMTVTLAVAKYPAPPVAVADRQAAFDQADTFHAYIGQLVAERRQLLAARVAPVVALRSAGISPARIAAAAGTSVRTISGICKKNRTNP